MVESVDPDVAKAIKAAHAAAARDLEEVLGSALNAFSRSEKRELMMTFHMVSSWPSWETLRVHYHLSPSRARSLISSVALTVLAEAERRALVAQVAAASDSRPASH
jgi:hypothetical protein